MVEHGWAGEIRGDNSDDARLVPAVDTLKGSRSNNFDVLRFVLAVAVFAAHSYPLVEGDAAREPLMRLTRGQIHMGEISVDGFFILSGFLVTQSWFRSAGVRNYLGKRLLRIVPGYVVAILFCVFLIGPLGSQNIGEYWSGFNLSFFLRGLINLYPPGPPAIPPVFLALPYPKALNGSMWTIRPEFICYLVVAALGLVRLLDRKAVIAIALVGLLAVLGRGDYQGLTVPILGPLDEWPRLAACFLVGIAFFAFRDRIPRSWALVALCTAVVVVAARVPGSLRWVLPVPLGYLLFALAFSRAVNLSGFARRGDFSYGIYLYAWPVQQLLVQSFGPQLAPEGLTAAAFLPTLLLAVLSWHFVERPFLALKSSARRPAEAAVSANR